MSGTATGVINFLNFTFSALLGPVFACWSARDGGAGRDDAHYQTAFEPLLYGRGLAIVLTLLLRRQGRRAGPPVSGWRADDVMNQTPGTGKYEQLLERCRSLAPIPTAVAHPCEETALAGAIEAAARADRADPRRPGREDRGDRPKRTGSISDIRRSSTPHSHAPPPRRWSWCARARPSC